MLVPIYIFASDLPNPSGQVFQYRVGYPWLTPQLSGKESFLAIVSNLHSELFLYISYFVEAIFLC